MREQRTLATAVGLVDRSNRDVLAVPGEERASWLHTLTTQHLSDLSAGAGQRAAGPLPARPRRAARLRHRGRHDGLAGHRARGRRGPAQIPRDDALLHQGRAARRDRRDRGAVAGRPGRGRSLPRAAPRPGSARCRARSSPPGPCRRSPPAATPYSAFEGGLARRVPLGVDLLVPRDGQDGGDREAGRAAGRPLGVRGDPGRAPHPAAGLGDRPPDHPGRGRVHRRRRAPRQGLLPRPGDGRPGAPPGPAAAPPGPAAPRRHRHRPAAGAGHPGRLWTVARSASSAPRCATTSSA